MKHPRRYVRTGIKLVLALVALVAVLASTVLWNATRKLERTIELDIAPVAYTTDATAVERGRYLFLARGCADCHGQQGEGRVFIDHSNGLYARGANLTTGRGSAVAGYTERDWVRSIRHGVGTDGKPLFLMPSDDYNRFSDEDLADLVAYVRALPPKDADGALVRLPLIVKAAYGLGILKDAAEKIDHTRPPSPPVENVATVERGRYVAQVCVGCHGSSLRGGAIPGAPPDWPPAANITSGIGGVMGHYETLEQFKTMMRTAVRPDGSRVSPVMPFEALKHTNDIDVEALYLFLKSPDSAS